MRDVPNYAVYFVLFDFFKNKFGIQSTNESDSWVWLSFKKFMAGGLAGCFAWGLVYPIDSVKI